MRLFRHIWIGYSSLQLALGYSFQQEHIKPNHNLILVRKSKRYNSHVLGTKRVFLYSPPFALFLLVYTIITRATLWVPGVSPTSCSALEKYCLRFLFFTGRLRIYDDGMAGFISDTYTWYHTLKVLPSALGQVTWNQLNRSPLFQNSTTVSVSLLKNINSGINYSPFGFSNDYTVFIEANGMNIKLLYEHFTESHASSENKIYFAHTDKGSVSNQFSSLAKTNFKLPKYNTYYSHQYMMLESYLLNLFDKARTLIVYSGCTSTILILLLYASTSDTPARLKVYYSPDYSNLTLSKVAQTRSFYKYISSNYPEQCCLLS